MVNGLKHYSACVSPGVWKELYSFCLSFTPFIHSFTTNGVAALQGVCLRLWESKGSQTSSTALWHVTTCCITWADKHWVLNIPVHIDNEYKHKKNRPIGGFPGSVPIRATSGNDIALLTFLLPGENGREPKVAHLKHSKCVSQTNLWGKYAVLHRQGVIRMWTYSGPCGKGWICPK